MSNKEIGLMQIRTGKQRNLPKALEHGELALTTDECRMFAGLPSAITPASLVAGRTAASVPGSGWENVEILTEFTPAHVLNRVLFKPVKINITSAQSDVNKTEVIINIPSADRLFVDYIAYGVSDTGTDDMVLETGTFNIVTIDGETMISQVNNTNDDEGIHKLEVIGATANGGITSVTVENSDTNRSFVYEYIYRGWKAPN